MEPKQMNALHEEKITSFFSYNSRELLSKDKMIESIRF